MEVGAGTVSKRATQVPSGWNEDSDPPSFTDSKNVTDVSRGPQKLSLKLAGVGVDIVRKIGGLAVRLHFDSMVSRSVLARFVVLSGVLEENLTGD